MPPADITSFWPPQAHAIIAHAEREQLIAQHMLPKRRPSCSTQSIAARRHVIDVTSRRVRHRSAATGRAKSPAINYFRADYAIARPMATVERVRTIAAEQHERALALQPVYIFSFSRTSRPPILASAEATITQVPTWRRFLKRVEPPTPLAAFKVYMAARAA